MKSAALKFAAAGIAVLPCNGKRATITPHGYLDATTDPDIIEAWWDAHPTANVAIHPGSAGLLVIDVDIKDTDGHASLGELEAKHGELRDTRTACTPSGGVHLYFKVPTDERFGNAKPAGNDGGIDIRCSAGYVLAPPSVICGKPYRWTNTLKAATLPDAWVDLLRDKPYEPRSYSDEQAGAPACGNVPSGHGARAKYLEAAYNDELELLLMAPEGDGNNQVCRFGFCLGQLIAFGIREDNIRAGAEWVFSQWQWRNRGDLATARRTLESGIQAGKAQPRGERHE